MLDVLGGRAHARTDVTSTSVKADDAVRLIFVDDDSDFREAAEAELEDLGFSVTSFADGWKLLASITKGTLADAIVLDWNMPAMNGMDLLRRLRDQESGFLSYSSPAVPRRHWKARPWIRALQRINL
jgi:CheY-like chemotaxis protein